MKLQEINKTEYKERTDDKKLCVVTDVSVKDSVFWNIVPVCYLPIPVSYTEYKNKKFLRNVCKISAFSLIAAIQKTITMKRISCLTF
jgi:hypothetical protein